LTKSGCEDLCICGGGHGGDLLFAEAAIKRNAKLELYIPFEEETFLQESVNFAGGDWPARFFAVKVRAILHVMPEQSTNAGDPYELNNIRMLEAAERFGPERVDFICLWNGQQGDGPGGTRHLMEEVRARGGRTHWLDTRKLWKL
jgi:hypothetical protein